MENRWADADVAELDEVDLLVYQSRLIGADPGLVVWGGGNTSLKVVEADFRGRETKVVRVKGSGSDMKSVERKDFPGVRQDDVVPLFEREEMSDEEMVEHLGRCLMEPDSPRPSIETLLHAFLPQKSVAHSHADAILALTNTKRASQILQTVFGRDVTVVEYRRPGFLLSKEVALAALRNPRARGVVLLNHGLVTWGTTPRQAYDAHIELVDRAEEFADHHARGKVTFGGVRYLSLDGDQRRQVAVTVAPTLRGLLSEERRVVLRYDDGPDVLELVNSHQGRAVSAIGPATPDHLLQTKRKPLWVDIQDPEDVPTLLGALRTAVEEYAYEYAEWYRQHQPGSGVMLDPYPRVVLVPGIGMWTTGRDARAAFISGDIYHHTVTVVRGAQAVNEYSSLSPRDAFQAEYWPLELYKLTLAPPEKELSRRVVLVTGAASGIGRAVARRLAAEGAHVVVTDLDEEGSQVVAEELEANYGEGRAVACRLDVTSEAEVAAAFEKARLVYGGLDIVVSNAGIAPVGALHDLPVEEWRRALEVNATGHFLVARETVRLLREQGIGGSIVFVGTKNVTAPGRDFGAYSASKAAEVQLARVLAMENGGYGIRCNIVNPDAVFRDSNLWSPEVRQRRAQAHGIQVEDLEDFYRERNLLKERITPEDVAEAVLFLASDRSAKTTGAMLPVDGGLGDAFPR